MEYLVAAALILPVVTAVILTRWVRRELNKREPDTGLIRREARLVDLYNNLEDLMDAFEGYLEEVRQELEEERAALTELSRQASALYVRAAEPPAPPRAAEPYSQADAPVPPADAPRVVRPAPEPDGGKDSRLSERDREALDRFVTKPQKVRFLMSRGLSIEEAARALDVGQGEVRLIASLEK